MSTRTAPPQAHAQLPESRARFSNLLVSEWTKLRSVRSTMWALILLVVLTLGITVLISAITSAQWHSIDPSDRATLAADPISGILGPAMEFGQLTIIVLGVLVMSSEYSTGAIRSSLLAVPKRLPMLAAKALVFGVVILIIAEIVAFLSFFIGAAILHAHLDITLSGPHFLRAVIGAGLYLTVLGLFSMAIGGLVRHTAGSITGAIAFVIVLAPLSQLIPGSWGHHIYDYLPTSAGQLVAQTHPVDNQVLPAWGGFAVFCIWTAALLIAAAVALRMRDA